jgi:hypothetical protein
MPHFVKVYSHILDSTIAETPLHIRWMWVTLLVLCDKEGMVYGTVGSLARRANLTLEQADEALEALMEPDPQSSSDAEDGCRLRYIANNQYKVVNYAKYRGLKDAEEVRRQTRERVQRYRERKRDVTHGNADVTIGNDDVTKSNDIVEVEVEVDNGNSNELPNTPAPPARKPPQIKPGQYAKDPAFVEMWTNYPRKKDKKDAHKAIIAARKGKDYPGDEAVRAKIIEFGVREWAHQEMKYIPYMSTWLRGGGWDDEPTDRSAKGKSSYIGERGTTKLREFHEPTPEEKEWLESQGLGDEAANTT